MVKQQDVHLDTLFGALADPTRRAMLTALARQPSNVGELAAPFQISLAAASKHIKVLEQAQLITREVQGRVHLCRLNAQPLHAGLEWLRHYERFWTERLDTLEALLREEARAARKPATPPARKRSPQ